MKNSKEDITEFSKAFENLRLLNKPVLTIDEACAHLGISKSCMYKKTSDNKIPFYKPQGKKLYFKRDELDMWMLKNRQPTIDEIRDEASKFKISKSGRK